MPNGKIIQIKPEPAAIRRRRMEMLDNDPTLSDAEVASAMEISEAEVVAAQVGFCVTRLIPDWDGIFRMLPRLGTIQAVTASGGAHIEAEGEFPQCQVQAGQAPRGYSVYSKEAIDLRVVIGHWHSAFLLAVPDAATGKRRRSIQFFGPDGSAIHKVFLTGASSVDAFEDIAERYVNPSQSQRVTAIEVPRRARAGTQGEARRRVRPQALAQFLNALREARVGAVAILGNNGCAQAYRGAVRRIAEWKGWISISASRRKLHLREADIAEAWVVEKETHAGTVRTLDLFDAQGGDAATFLALRAEREDAEAVWKEALDGMPGVAIA